MDWQRIIYVLPGILLGLTVHEYCHALAAWKLGDSTARNQGRVTLNPIRHIDPIGFLLIIFAGFGWAKPVQFDPEQLQNFRRDRAIIAFAGPLSNFALAIFLSLVVRAILHFNTAGFDGFSLTILQIVHSAAAINFMLFVFNMLPIPPLDGSHIVFSVLNTNPETEATLRKIGMPALFVILIIQNFADITILPIGSMVRAMVNFFMM